MAANRRPAAAAARERVVRLTAEPIEPTAGDATDLPYPDGSCDAAYLDATLGEIPDQERALREPRRIRKPGGRLVVGEGQPDPHMVRADALTLLAKAAGLALERRAGGRHGFLARFRPEPDCRGGS